jgi:hypothetical protein
VPRTNLTAEAALPYRKAVRKLSREEFLRARRTSPEAHDVARHRGGVALCFGRQTPATVGEFLDLDLIAMAIVDRLVRFFEDRKDAADCVRGYWPHWLTTLARAEDAKREDYIFFVGTRVDRNHRSQGLVIRSGTFNDVVQEIAAWPANKKPSHHYYVDLLLVAEEVRADAKAADVELDDRFFYSLDDPRSRAAIMEGLRTHAELIRRERKSGLRAAAKPKYTQADVERLLEGVRVY